MTRDGSNLMLEADEPERPPWTDEEADAGTQASAPSEADMQVDTDGTSSDRQPTRVFPVWLRESSKTFRWRWVPVQIRQTARHIVAWSEGPSPPHIQKIEPWFVHVQQGPARLIESWCPKPGQRMILLMCFLTLWLLTFSLVLHHSARGGTIEGYGRPQPIWCGASFWSQDNECGLDGNLCRPFGNATFAFRCPANCQSTKVLNPRAIGDQEVNYCPYVIGGSPSNIKPQSSLAARYRGDTFICQAAIHAGIVRNANGGCGVVQLTGEHADFVSTSSNGIKSFSFDSTFPKSFTFIQGLSATCVEDLRWPLLAVTCSFTAILSLCTNSAPAFFSSIFVMLFFHVGLVSDPPNHSDYVSLISLIIGRFLPAAFVAAVLYRYSVKLQLSGLSANVERTILWLGGAWIGALNNYTFYHIPLERLTPHDLRTQPGAILSLILVVLVILFISLGQAWYLREEGRFRKYLAIYASMGGMLLVCVAIPQLNLRIHHYFLAILLLPGTRMQTRPGLLYQGILIGLFINGTARWGFDSIMQTANDLRGDGQLGSLLPNITIPLLGTHNITFGWSTPPSEYDGISVLVNDVERYRWYHGEGPRTHTFDRYAGVENEYFRFAYMSGSTAGDYTKAGVWNKKGSWTPMLEGPSR